MKKIISLILTLALCVSLSACGSTKKSESADVSAADGENIKQETQNSEEIINNLEDWETRKGLLFLCTPRRWIWLSKAEALSLRFYTLESSALCFPKPRLLISVFSLSQRVHAGEGDHSELRSPLSPSPCDPILFRTRFKPKPT